MKNSLFERSLKNIFRNKINIISIILLAISSAIIIYGFSYVTSIFSLWGDWTRKAIDFRTLIIYYDYEKMSEDEALEKLRKYKHIEDVTTSAGYLVGGNTIKEFINDKFDGSLTIRGVTKNSLRIIKGSDFSDEENELICAMQFNPTSNSHKVDYDINEMIDLTGYIGKTLEINVAGSENVEKFKLIGVYDTNYDYSAGDVCYATFNTVRKLNEKYQPHVFGIGENAEDDTYYPVYVIIDDADNLDEVATKLEKDGFYSEVVTRINTKVGDRIIRIVLILTWVTCILSLAIILITSLRRINEQKKEFAICKAIGYMKKDINRNLYLESIIISCISFIVSIIFAIIALIILKNYVLVSNVEFSRMDLNISGLGMIVAFIVSCIIPIIATYISTKKIDEINILSLLKG